MGIASHKGFEDAEAKTDSLNFKDSKGKVFTYTFSGTELVRQIDAKNACAVKRLVWSVPSRDETQGVLFDQLGYGCIVPCEALPKLRELAIKAGVSHNLPEKANCSGEISFSEMSAFAREVIAIEKKKQRLRFFGVISAATLIFTAALIAGLLTFFPVFGEYEVRMNGFQLVLAKRSSNKVLGVEDRDGADLVDYDRSVEGEDGAWVVPSNRLELVRTVSWWEDSIMQVQHVSSISRHGGKIPHVDIVTKAGHELTIWDSNDEDLFTVMMRRWDNDEGVFGEWEEVNAEGDSDEMGRGRVVVSLRRPRFENAEDFATLDRL